MLLCGKCVIKRWAFTNFFTGRFLQQQKYVFFVKQYFQVSDAAVGLDQLYLVSGTGLSYKYPQVKQISNVYLGSYAHPPPAFGLIYEGAISQQRQTTFLCNPLQISNWERGGENRVGPLQHLTDGHLIRVAAGHCKGCMDGQYENGKKKVIYLLKTASF